MYMCIKTYVFALPTLTQHVTPLGVTSCSSIKTMLGTLWQPTAAGLHQALVLPELYVAKILHVWGSLCTCNTEYWHPAKRLLQLELLRCPAVSLWAWMWMVQTSLGSARAHICQVGFSKDLAVDGNNAALHWFCVCELFWRQSGFL